MDYKKYSLEQLDNWMHDAMSCGDATPQEIYDVIMGVVKDNYYTYKKQASEAYELLSLLNGNGGWTVEEVLKEKEYYEPSMPPWGHSDLEYLACNKDDPSPECQKSWNDFWEDVDEKHSREYNLREAEYYNQRAKLDAEYEAIKAAGGYEWTPEPPKDKVVKWQLPVQQNEEDYFVEFPNDLLEAANLKEGDTVEWVDNGDGSYLLKKV
jgi:hypothetical protein